ncbi:MAG: bifunctional riboflavin kinase/FAD synthetase [Deltaproteobacteria bacterium]
MRMMTTWQGLKADDRGASVALGNFDGVHLGHQSVIDLARRVGQPLGVVTFEPHPRQFFSGDAQTFRLTNAETRANRLAAIGVERVYQLPFDAGLASLTPEAFVNDVLVHGLGLTHVAIGPDFCFGKGRAGTADDLVRLAGAQNLPVTIAPVLAKDGARVSSTLIRQALAEGRPRDAATLLGHPHTVDGEVLGGDRRGRELGYPTANMSIAGLFPPKFGIYAVRVKVLTGAHQGDYIGAASIGVRPMFGVNTPNLETFIFDFSGDLYGEHLSVSLVEYLRPEAKFDSLDALVKQMDADCARARDILQTR